MKESAPSYRRKRKHAMTILEAQKEAHKIAFYPMMFQAIRTMINNGLLGCIVKGGITKENLAKETGLPPYALGLLLDVAVLGEIAYLEGEKYFPTKLAEILLKDEAIKVNMAFMNDVCYQGAFRLEESFKTGKPEGLKVFGGWETIYQGLGSLPPDVQKSWFDFDNFYSDLVFDEAIRIVMKDKPKLVYDIGGNTAKFDIALLNAYSDVRSAIFDLPPQLEKARQNIKAAGLEGRTDFNAIDVLDATSLFPKGADAIWMSQFLDCFSPEKIVFILQKLQKSMKDSTRIFILEPLVDIQENIEALALTNISLYFTCMANGYSRMYKQDEMLGFIRDAGLKFVAAHHGLGEFNYTLLECMKA